MASGVYLHKPRLPISEETRLKLKLSHIGYCPTEAARESMSKAQKGRKHGPMSEEQKKQISQTKMGSIPWNKGIPQLQSTGEKHHNWKGGTSRVYKTGYYSREYKQWRISVFERDGYRCQGCDIVGGYLTAHHIKSFARYSELRYDINNGITLCEECHKLTDNYKGRNNRGVS